MGKIEFPLLGKDDIEVRIATFKEDKGAQLLLYKDARADMNILDATLGLENWQRRHYECKGNLFCSIGINVNVGTDTSAWVWKDDCGAESNVEKEKGEASDSFKRACTIGVSLAKLSPDGLWLKMFGDFLQAKMDGSFEEYRNAGRTSETRTGNRESRA